MALQINIPTSPNQEIQLPDCEFDGFFLKRVDQNHPKIQGNKLHKLKYNLIKAAETGHDTLLTFGGAFSNHIYATAAAGAEYGFETIGIIRGEEPAQLSPTLEFAQSQGMQLQFISREEYREKNEDFFKAWLRDTHGRFYLIPEGGSNYLGVMGCTEILNKTDESYDIIACPCGTAATLAGISLSLKPHQNAIGFSSLKGGEFLNDDLQNFLYLSTFDHDIAKEIAEKTEIATSFHFGGYAKIKPELSNFIKEFESINNIRIEHVYTAKMLFGLREMALKDEFKNKKVLAIHTGGLQGRLDL